MPPDMDITFRATSFLLRIQCNLDLVTLNLVATCDLVTVFQRPFINLQHEIIRFSDIM